MAKYLDMPGLTYFYNQIKNRFASKTDVGTPTTASTSSAMTNHNKIYVYTGSEDGYTFGDWYYYDDGSWQSGGQYHANVYETDKTLATEDMPADAKAAGDEISDLKNALEPISFLIVADEYVDNNTGEFVTYNNWSRSEYIDLTNYESIIIKWDGSNSNKYNAFYNAQMEFMANIALLPSSKTNINIPSQAKYLVVSNTSANMPKFTIKGKPLKSKRDFPLLPLVYRYDENTEKGITFSVTNGVSSFSGKASDVFTFNYFTIEPEGRSISDYFESNSTYYLDIDKNREDNVWVRVVIYTSNETRINIFNSKTSGFFTIPNTNEIEYMYIRAYIPSDSSVNCTLKINVQKISNSLIKGANNRKKIRVMQNNVGKFRWGYSNSGSLEQWGLTEEQYIIKLQNYKKMYGEYGIDILGTQEMVKYMDKAQTHSSSEELYDPIFSDSTVSKNDNNVPQVYTNEKILYYSRVLFSGTQNDVTKTIAPVISCININEKPIAVVSGALEAEPENTTIRTQQWTAMLDFLELYDNAIILFDMNVATDSELTSIISVAENRGYTAANYDYWGRQESYIAHPGHIYYNMIDNILVKGDIKITNFEVLYDEVSPDRKFNETGEYTNSDPIRTNPANDKLASDHVPVIADLIIY